MKSLIPVLAVLICFPYALATVGMEPLKVPEGAISKVDTYLIDTKIENWGYDRVFVALPEGWEIDPIEQSAIGYKVRDFPEMWEAYGRPYNQTYGELKRWVYTYSGEESKLYKSIAGRQGWYLLPNEGMRLNIKVGEISTGGGDIDPLKIERENPGIKVIKWKQRFIMEVSSKGFITAPWVVINSALAESSPAVYSLYGLGASRYYEDYTISPDVTKWDKWFTFRNSLSGIFSSKPLAATNLEFLPSEEVRYIKPVWKIDTLRKIMYGYQWERDKEIQGIYVWRNDFKDVPAWFEWF
ncbi:MAG: hypothetical protein ACE5NL_01160 [Candidatus Hydrothermarchaeaceae archaeon]